MKLFPLLIFTYLSLLITNATAQGVAVYRLESVHPTDSINYKPYLGGFYVAPAIDGVGSLVLQRQDADGLMMITLADFGELFVAADGKRKQRSVLSATAANSVSATSFMAIGKPDTTFKAKGANFDLKVDLARTLEGYAMSADSQNDMPFVGGEGDIGVAGIAPFKAVLDLNRSETANRANADVAAAITQIEESLELLGYSQAETVTDTAAPNTEAGAATQTEDNVIDALDEADEGEEVDGTTNVLDEETTATARDLARQAGVDLTDEQIQNLANSAAANAAGNQDR